MFIFSA